MAGTGPNAQVSLLILLSTLLPLARWQSDTVSAFATARGWAPTVGAG